MANIITSFGFDALPTAIIIALSGAILYLLKREFKRFSGRFDGFSSRLGGIESELHENNLLTKACGETSRLLLLEKMRVFVSQNIKTPDRDAYFRDLYRRFEELGNGDDSGLLAIWNAKPFVIKTPDLK